MKMYTVSNQLATAKKATILPVASSPASQITIQYARSSPTCPVLYPGSDKLRPTCNGIFKPRAGIFHAEHDTVKGAVTLHA